MWEIPKESRPKCVKACEHHEKETIYIDYYVRAKIEFLMRKYYDIEWLAYLVGDKEKNIVKDIFIPTQKVTATSVTEIETPSNVQIMGVIHSHHKLGLQNFSGIDHDYINDNHDLSILVWHGGIKAQKKVKLPCGSILISDAYVDFFHELFEPESLDKESGDNITEKTFTAGYATGVANGVPVTITKPSNGNGKAAQTATSTWAKKKENGTNGSGKKLWESGQKCAPAVDDDGMPEEIDFAKHLGPLVYGSKTRVYFDELDERSEDDIEEHFRRIEERECGVTPGWS